METNETSILTAAIPKFKSYYVVWKPERRKEIDEGKEEGLNRTM